MINSPALPEKAVLGSCEIRAVLGQGGGGISYLAYDKALEREVVIKEHFPMGLCLRQEGSAAVKAADDALYRRSLATFCREARILAGLNHPNVVKVHDIFEGSGTAYLVMEYVEGSTLKEWLPNHAGDVTAVRRVLEQLLLTLHYLHGNSVLHRDIKPGNIIIREDGHPIIIDFGCAHLGTANHTLTPVGSPGYAAPEQFSPKGRVGAWSDLYALAQCFLHHLPAKQKKRYPRRFLKSLQKAAAPEAEHRYRTATQWLETLHSNSRNKAFILILTALLAGGITGGLSLHALHNSIEDSQQKNPPMRADKPVLAPDAHYHTRKNEIVERYRKQIDELTTKLNSGTLSPEEQSEYRHRINELQDNKIEELDQLLTLFAPESIGLNNAPLIYDSSGQQPPNDSRIKKQAERLHTQYKQDLLIYLRQAKEQGISEQEQQRTREKFRADLEDKLRELPQHE